MQTAKCNGTAYKSELVLTISMIDGHAPELVVKRYHLDDKDNTLLKKGYIELHKSSG